MSEPPAPLTVCLVQPVVVAQNIDKNLAHMTDLINSMVHARHIDLIVLPEMFNCGFTSQPTPVAESPVDGKSLRWMKTISKEKKVAVVGSIVVEENMKYYNRLFFVTPEGDVSSYDKKHLFTMGDEALHFTPGNHKTIVNYKGWKINFAICYDIRFPVWLRNDKKDPYDILIVVAAWSSDKRHHWMSLTTARAIENSAYLLAANNCGVLPDSVPGKPDLVFTGDCRILDPFGIPIKEALPGVEQLIYATLDYEELHLWRNHFPVLNDEDDFKLL
ncbi:hypothetical protein EIN_370950 [Entamoeba invadens IP1]|uniref:CN hydrolase domain-containing protein n=1 Tax=Entamoeba invadens IP1 TaxID=370355 RepID=A0A0A1UC42_ENTIV|nr:hypothetical protein EIN_370950 [Entamoeba invadens IP1]ELP92693.1 hypothetical protein EIN_370950 [Entamoeba invadens IP1]|eukprot:XP_004259464.1 hypothetical protein EIN_370950 [Entamoeba invadens IP1]